MALCSCAGTKSTRPHGFGEILMTFQLGRVMNQRLPLDHTQADLGKGHQEKHLEPPWLPFPPPGKNGAENASFLVLARV